jgi:transcriptional regulator NrdR family protein
MVCIHCGAKTHVLNSRLQRRNNQVWRRRQCSVCGAVFTTEESALYSASWRVQGDKGTLKPFSRDKLLLSLYKSCGHRSTALSDAAGLVDTIIKRLLDQADSGLLNKETITGVCLVVLSRFDKSAGVHYLANHSSV